MCECSPVHNGRENNKKKNGKIHRSEHFHFYPFPCHSILCNMNWTYTTCATWIDDKVSHARFAICNAYVCGVCVWLRCGRMTLMDVRDSSAAFVGGMQIFGVDRKWYIHHHGAACVCTFCTVCTEIEWCTTYANNVCTSLYASVPNIMNESNFSGQLSVRDDEFWYDS